MSIEEFILLFRRRFMKKKKDKRRASSVDILSKKKIVVGNKKMSASTYNLENPFSFAPNSVQIDYRPDSDSYPESLVPEYQRPFKRNPSKKKNVLPEISFRSGFAQVNSKRTSSVLTQTDSPFETDVLAREQPMEEIIWQRRSYKVYELSPENNAKNFPVTTFPVEEDMSHIEREQLASPTVESGYESGRVSGLELSMPASHEASHFNSPLSSTTSASGKRNSILYESPKSMEALNDPKIYKVPVVLETSFDDNEINTHGILKPDLLRQSQRDHAKSELVIRPSYRSKSVDSAVRYLQKRVRETKYITAVFESAKGGLSEMLDDVLKEFTLWLGEKSSLLGIAVEMHWSVPESLRSRAVEIKLKDALHRELRNNNKRVLNLYEECREHLPSNFIESKIEENCFREKSVNAFQGIYRRYYPELFDLQDKRTVKSHSMYWTFENIHDVTRSLPTPNPGKFLFHGPPEILAERSILALNLATLRLDDSI
uniref:Uncharacterized protein n=1 Tax=Panagrolaimus sp. JU765 TaxID=591449 RepID=A0AC34QK40_9BILA